MFLPVRETNFGLKGEVGVQLYNRCEKGTGVDMFISLTLVKDYLTKPNGRIQMLNRLITKSMASHIFSRGFKCDQ